MMKTALLTALIALTPAMSFAEDEEWVMLTMAGTSKWEAKKRSGELIVTKGGVPATVIIGRVIDSKSNVIDLAKWYVQDSQCDAGMGTLVTLGLDGKFKYEVDFIFKGGTVASQIAEAICKVHSSLNEEREKKGI